MARVAGFDASSTLFGWAVYDSTTGKVIASGLINLKKTPTLGIKLKIVHDEIVKICRENKVDFVVIEDIYLKNVTTLALLAEVRAAVRLAVYPRELHAIATNTMKKDIGLNSDKKASKLLAEIKEDKSLSAAKRTAANRKVKKEAVMRLVNEKFGLKIKVDDISDAVAIAYSFSLQLPAEED